MSYLENKIVNTTNKANPKNRAKETATEHNFSNLHIYFDAELKKELQSIPERFYFKIGEAAELLNLNTSVLRYWETEFTTFAPDKSKKNQRIYKKKDVELLFLIRKLLHKDRFSIQGAKKLLSTAKKEFRTFYQEKQVQEKIKNSLSLLQNLVLEIKNSKKQFI